MVWLLVPNVSFDWLTFLFLVTDDMSSNLGW